MNPFDFAWFDLAHHTSGSIDSPSLELSRAMSRENHAELVEAQGSS